MTGSRRLAFALVGDPVAHSASPRMHAAAYAALGLDASYALVRASAEDLPAVVGRLRTGELAGLNVTIPHKGRVLLHADAVDEPARLARAANTLVLDGARVLACNTDVPAIARELRALTSGAPRGGWGSARALILGTGGAARAALIALARDLGIAEIAVRGRAFADDGALAEFRADVVAPLQETGVRARITLEPWAPREETDRFAQVLVQATSSGMAGGAPGEIAAGAVAWSVVAEDAVALDVVYSEAMTRFVAAASARGLRAADGRGVLACQGAIAFERWLGLPAPFDAMRAAL